MLTRIELDGFKNLVEFALDLGPYTCIAGVNGAGKSNLFDAIRFLSLLTDHTINQAARQIRSADPDAGEIGDLLFTAGGEIRGGMTLAAEMIVDRQVVDDFGRPGAASSTFLRYELAFRHQPPSGPAGPFEPAGGLVLEREVLRHVPSHQAARKLRFSHSRPDFRRSVIYNKRRGPGYVSTAGDGASEPAQIVIHRDGGAGHARPPAPAARAPRTAVGTEHTAATPTMLAARREMQAWRVLALDPAAMRRPDTFTDEPGIAADGRHLPVTLHHLARQAATTGSGEAVPGEPGGDVLHRIARRLSGLMPVEAVRAVSDDLRRLHTLELRQRSGVRLRAGSIADGTLRFLALATIAETTGGGVYCVEEPENGIHPAKLPALNRLLHDIAVDLDRPVGAANPLRQVLVATHSPYFVQLQRDDELLLAANPAAAPLQLLPVQGSWRARPGRSAGVARTRPRTATRHDLEPYLMPPVDIQLRFPAEFWPETP